MKDILSNVNRKEVGFIFSLLILLIILVLLPTGFDKQLYTHTEGARAKVLSVDNSNVLNTGLFKQGDQRTIIKIETGSYKGQIVDANNMLTGSLAEDKLFVEGDKAWVLIGFDENGNINFANMVDHYRLNKEAVLIWCFALVIVIFLGFTGVRTLLSFAFALLSIWKILIPAMLKGFNPILIALIVGNTLTIITSLLVAGFTKKSYAAIISTISCSFATCILAIIFGNYFNIHGAVMTWSESLLYAGFLKLDLTAIFQAGIYLASSGAILDLAVDISSALEEIVNNNPSVTKKDLILSGFNIGKSVVGTQTTTLLFAYMGSYLSVMMVYMAQETPMLNILNSKTIAAEILHTFVGCIGLVLVSPLTSVICGFLFEKGKGNGKLDESF
ncbi:YibE/F family protein [Tissierella sp. MB52-C2]|uniref:YibE/F family protein n=1 Tax=Tissierella sp. MB52-C2 TaxID=3070999 RepID=UPI00280C02D7|nr:YibE/F family protein [Tissierella sp. MB52-C2]WMM25194.1 YibE/F family protein [Tissierella sp. MB52-C2]